MKIEKLTENKIRIIINLDELSNKNIDASTLVQNNDASKKLFNSILEEAEKQVGFKVSNCKLLVEAFSTSDGAIIFTLTKYKNELNTESLSKKLSFKRKSINISAKNAIYKFNSFDEFCSFCTYCNSSKLSDLNGFAQNISLYEYKKYYYLVISKLNSNFEHAKLFYTSISEFSSLASNSIIFKSQLEEYGTVIFRNNAIKNGIKFFVKL